MRHNSKNAVNCGCAPICMQHFTHVVGVFHIFRRIVVAPLCQALQFHSCCAFLGATCSNNKNKTTTTTIHKYINTRKTMPAHRHTFTAFARALPALWSTGSAIGATAVAWWPQILTNGAAHR